MDYSKNAETFAAGFEGYSSTSVHHPEDPEDVWTMGFGSTYWLVDRKIIKVVEGMTCTRDQALLQLDRGLESASLCVSLTVHVPLTQNEHDACTDLVYNIGCTRWTNSTARARINAGDLHGGAAAFEMWDRAGGHVMAGLLRRRVAEEKLFNA